MKKQIIDDNKVKKDNKIDNRPHNPFYLDFEDIVEKLYEKKCFNRVKMTDFIKDPIIKNLIREMASQNPLILGDSIRRAQPRDNLECKILSYMIGLCAEYMHDQDPSSIMILKGREKRDFPSGLKKGTIKIIGKVFGQIGCEMSGGNVIVEGDVFGPLCMNMEAGYALVEGNVNSFFTAGGMRGGTIVIKGNAKGIYDMGGGEVIVYGDIEKVEGTIGGDIYVGGKYNLFGKNKAKIWNIEDIAELKPEELIGLTVQAKSLLNTMKVEGKIIKRKLSPDRLIIITEAGEFYKEMPNVITLR